MFMFPKKGKKDEGKKTNAQKTDVKKAPSPPVVKAGGNPSPVVIKKEPRFTPEEEARIQAGVQAELEAKEKARREYLIEAEIQRRIDEENKRR